LSSNIHANNKSYSSDEIDQISLAELGHLKQKLLLEEENRLSPFAALSKNHQRLSPNQEDHRLPYRRDVDRIIHSKSYVRYADKTQVVYLVDYDHLTQRSLHVQLVSAFARGIGQYLGLNTDLIEAIALGHDIGHAPFGHEGERYLSALAKEHGHHPFAHPWQSCRLFREIEPLNLCLAVYDGFLCHDGGMVGYTLEPKRNKTWDDHFAELNQKALDPEAQLMPTTLEGCLVKICDTVSYLGRDFEDAIRLGLIQRSDLPDTPLGNTNRNLLKVVATDMIKQSEGTGIIALSPQIYDALKELRKFNFRNVYVNPILKTQSSRIKHSYRHLFTFLLKEYETDKERSYLWKNYIKNKSEKYKESTPPVQIVVDFISGMTDTFFLNTLEMLMIPRRIEIGRDAHHHN
jgi:dGTPase